MIMGAEHNLTCTIKCLDNLYKLHIINQYLSDISAAQCRDCRGWGPRPSQGGGWRDGVAVVVVLTVEEDDEALIIQTSCEDSELHSLQLFE